MSLNWLVHIDPQKCSFCEVCIKRCPTGALMLGEDEHNRRILFDQKLCHGCHDEPLCVRYCPEERTLTIKQTSAKSKIAVVLMQSESVECQACGKRFAPQKKLDVLVKKGKIKGLKDYHTWRPDCRRRRLLNPVR